jgi:hypothetical protein
VQAHSRRVHALYQCGSDARTANPVGDADLTLRILKSQFDYFSITHLPNVRQPVSGVMALGKRFQAVGNLSARRL